MKKRTICEAAIEALTKNSTSMTLQEIYDAILKHDLYQFKAANPVSVLRSELIKHSIGAVNKNQSSTKYFRLNENNKFDLLK